MAAAAPAPARGLCVSPLRRASSLLAPRGQIRNHSNGAPNGESQGPVDKSMRDATVFVKNLKEIFTSGLAQEELGEIKRLSGTVKVLNERISLYTPVFWGAALIVVPGSLAINTGLYFQHAKLEAFKSEQEKLEEEMKAMEKRVFALEYASSYKEKRQMFMTKSLEARPPPTSKGKDA